MIHNGKILSKGIGIGAVFCLQSYEPSVEEFLISSEQIPNCLSDFLKSIEMAKSELENIYANYAQIDERKAAIFLAHIDILNDESIIEEIQELITSDKQNPKWASKQVFDQYVEIMCNSPTPLFRERATDVLDVRNRLLRCFDRTEDCSIASISSPVILVARDLFPSQTAALDPALILGIITEQGGETSHTAILARSLEIPAIAGIDEATARFSSGQIVILDALDGYVIPSPTEDEFLSNREKQREYDAYVSLIKTYENKEAITTDGVRIQIDMNIGSSDSQDLSKHSFVDGVGLFRSEFLYLESNCLPDEHMQANQYRKVLTLFGDRPVILRTMDIGGDKQLDCLPLPQEENPFLGTRGIRLSFLRPDLFRVQLRAALRASVVGNLWLMLPMVNSMDDIVQANEHIQSVKKELDAENILYKNVPIGIMIETPAIALMTDKIVDCVDFASIGTNDLTQYLLAVDRTNPCVAKYYHAYHPGLIRLMKNVVNTFNCAQKPISICGELGGDLELIPVLLGLGFRKLSMNYASTAYVKQVIQNISIVEAETIAANVLDMDTSDQIKAYLHDFYKNRFSVKG